MSHDESTGDITELLRAASSGDQAAEEQLYTRVYDELRSLARALLRKEATTTLEPNGLVHEAFLRLGNSRKFAWADRHHFYGVAARAMRQVLVDRARARRSNKRAGVNITLPEDIVASADGDELIMAVDSALKRLAKMDPRCARVVELRWFAGLDVADVAQILGVGTATVSRDWAAAKAWLAMELGPQKGADRSAP